ncbi:MAG: N-6 DNA methylase, partial [Opitutae bacterium]|nr:N-6 DNA methylase [Opitutae bacterium]
MTKELPSKSLESWIWDAACSIRGAKDAPKYKDYILPLIFTKRLCDVFDDELNPIAQQVGSRKKAFQLVEADPKLVRFYLPLIPDDPEQPVWSVIRKLSDRIGEAVTTHMRAIARENPLLQGIIDRVDFNATTHGQRDLNDDRLSNLIEAISTKRLGLEDVEADVKGDIYEGLLEKNAEDTKSGAGQYFTPRALIRAMVECVRPEPGKLIADPACGTGGFFLAAYDFITNPKNFQLDKQQKAFLKHEAFHGNEIVANTRRLCLMNMFLHNIGEIDGGVSISPNDSLVADAGKRFDYVLANPPFGKKSSMSFTNEEGEQKKDSLTYNRQDFWATTSNKQLNFVQHIR